MIGEENLFEEGIKQWADYNASVDAECVVYECLKKNLKQACDQLPIMKQFMRLQCEAKRAVLGGIKTLFKEKTKMKAGEMRRIHNADKNVDLVANRS